MEDDVYLLISLNEFDQYMNSVPNDWDMVFIGGNHLYGNPPVSVNEKIIKLNHTVAIHCIAIKPHYL